MKTTSYIYFVVIILLCTSCASNLEQEENLDFIIEVQFGNGFSEQHIFLSAFGNIDINRVFLAVNDSLFQPNNTLPFLQNISGNLNGVLRYEEDDIFDEILVSYNGKTTVFYDPLIICPPINRFGNLDYDYKENNSLLVRWDTCRNTDTDYSIVKLISTTQELGTSDVLFTTTSEFTVASDSSFIPSEFIPFFDEQNNMRRFTHIEISNIKGAFPGEKRNVPRSELPITFSVINTASGDIYYE